MRKYELGFFAQKIQNEKEESASAIKKQKQDQGRKLSHFPSFAVFDIGLSNKCSICPESWYSNDKKKRLRQANYEELISNQDSLLKYAQSVVHPNIKSKSTHSKIDRGNDVYFAFIPDYQYNDKCFERFIEIDRQQDAKQQYSKDMFTYFMDRYHTSSGSTSSCQTTYIESCQKARV